MNKRVKEIVKELFEHYLTWTVETKRYIYYRDFNADLDIVMICRMYRGLFKRLGGYRYIPDKVLATMPKDDWDKLITY